MPVYHKSSQQRAHATCSKESSIPESIDTKQMQEPKEEISKKTSFHKKGYFICKCQYSIHQQVSKQMSLPINNIIICELQEIRKYIHEGKKMHEVFLWKKPQSSGISVQFFQKIKDQNYHSVHSSVSHIIVPPKSKVKSSLDKKYVLSLKTKLLLITSPFLCENFDTRVFFSSDQVVVQKKCVPQLSASTAIDSLPLHTYFFSCQNT